VVKILKVDPLEPDVGKIQYAAEAIRSGKLVAFPTETVYGLGCNALDDHAARRVFLVKERPIDNPLIVHITGVDMLDQVVEDAPGWLLEIADRVWPGPLTFVLKKSKRISNVVTAGRDTVAVRAPAHPVAQMLIKLAGVPIAAPSANKAGRPSPTRAEHVVEDLGDGVDVILDGGETFFGVESTIVDVTVKPPRLLRPGPFTLDELRRILGEVEVPNFARGLVEHSEAISPGVRYKHYAPNTPLILVEGSSELLYEVVSSLREMGLRVAVLCSRESLPVEADSVLVWGSRKSLYEIAKRLYELLREVDRVKVDVAVAEGVEERGIGLAVMNRLRKAAEYRIVRSVEDLGGILHLVRGRAKV